MSKFVTQFSWSETPHLDEKGKADLAASYLPHELKARTMGVPALGAGAIYPIDEAEIICEPFEFPLWYRFAYGMDVGWNRTAVIWGALDPETDVFYLWNEYFRGATEPPIHAAAIQSRGKWIPGVIDPAARGRSQVDGQQLFSMYVGLGLNLTPADNAVESGIYNVWSRMSTGRLKVFRTLQNWLAEFRIYRRDEKGKVVKSNDHGQDATRYLCSSGITLAAQRPSDQWMGRTVNGIPVGKPKHQFQYDPMAASWQPPSVQQGSAANTPRQWMPHSQK